MHTSSQRNVEPVNKRELCSVMKMTNKQAELTPQFAERENLHSLL